MLPAWLRLRRPVVPAPVAAALDAMGNAPDTAYGRAQRAYAERDSAPRVEAARYFALSVVLALVAAALALALARLAPLKTVVPYVIQIDDDTGAVRGEPAPANFDPPRNARSYFMGKWVRQLLTLDPYTTQASLREAIAVTRGQAITQFQEFLGADNPMGRMTTDPGLRRTVQINSINPGKGDGVAFVRVTTTERSGPGKARVQRHFFTLHYRLQPPQTEAEVLANPLGIFITHFDRVEELS